MTNAEYQAKRIAQGPSLLAALHKLIEAHCEEQGLEPVSALRDALTDMRHLADIHQLDFGELDQYAYEGYLEELGAVLAGEVS
jgi:hypothetical protein